MPQHLRTPLEDFGVFIYRLCALQNESNASDTIKHISLPAFVRAGRLIAKKRAKLSRLLR